MVSFRIKRLRVEQIMKVQQQQEMVSRWLLLLINQSISQSAYTGMFAHHKAMVHVGMAKVRGVSVTMEIVTDVDAQFGGKGKIPC